MDVTPEQMRVSLEVLQQISEDPSQISGHERMKGLIAKIHKEGKRIERSAACLREQGEDQRLRDAASTAAGQRLRLPSALPIENVEPAPASLNRPAQCYVCKTRYTEIHPFYRMMCPPCGDLNYARRGRRADLTGRTALITGGRIKIGFQTALRLLRDGARVLVTTRFSRDAALRFQAEPDFEAWQDRLTIYALDMRSPVAVEAFIDHILASEPHLDILINNAAQTIRRSPEFYRAEREREGMPLFALPSSAQKLIAPMGEWAGPLEIALSDCVGLGLTRLQLESGDRAILDAPPNPQFWGNGSPLKEVLCDPRVSPYCSELENGCSPAANAFPPPELGAGGRGLELGAGGRIVPATDEHGQPIDASARNSWLLKLHEVGGVEMLEVQMVNAIAPFMLASSLKPLLLRSPYPRRFVINVSAMEGQFYRENKTEHHPHTNMAKAALNMMTRTSAADYARDGIFMNSVDTGWITDENPLDKQVQLREEHGFFTPLDVIDGAARIYDPIAQAINCQSEPTFGQFLKDYAPCPW